MIITGRLTGDAVVRMTKDKQVVRFRLVQNYRYRDKGGGYVDEQQFYECSYWQQPAIVRTLKQGSIVELCGRVKPRAWLDATKKVQCELTFHVDHLHILGTTGYQVFPERNVEIDLPDGHS